MSRRRPAKTGLFKEPKRENAVDLVIGRIKQALIDKQLRPGDKLPSEKELAEGLSVSRGSVREAIKILAAFGVVATQHGDGTYIGRGVSEAFLGPLLFSLIVSDPEAEKLIELREMIELGIIRILVKKGLGPSLAAVSSALKNLEDCSKSGDASPADAAEADIAFHRALGTATGNEPVEKIYSFVLDYFRPFTVKLHEKPEYRKVSLELHRGLFKAIRNKDTGIAERALEVFNVKWEKLF